MRQRKHKLSGEQGFASIVISLIMIIVLALLSVAFAQLARREQQNALNKQLSNQAYYAAESGVNDAYTAIKRWAATNSLPNNLDGTSCIDTQAVLGTSSSLDAAHGVSISCMLLNLQPPTIIWQNVSPDSDRSATFSVSGGVKKITVYWGSAVTGHDTPSTDYPKLLTSADWGSKGYPPLLEISLTSISGAFSRASLAQNTFTAFLYPSKNGSTVSFNDRSKPIVEAADCTQPAQHTDFPCSVTIDNLNGNPTDSYLIHIINHYVSANIELGNARTGNGAGGGAQKNIVNGQAEVDVTGRARNVLKRLQVRIPLSIDGSSSGGFLPPVALDGQSICKRIQVENGAGSYDNPYSGVKILGNFSTACQFNNNN